MDTLTPQEILDTIAQPTDVRPSRAPAPSRLPAITVALVVIAVGSLSMRLVTARPARRRLGVCPPSSFPWWSVFGGRADLREGSP